jgi:hypothetical protein
MREALYPSGAKDDPRDADLLLDLLLQHRNKLRRLSPDTEATRRVQNLVEERRKLVDEKTEQSNRLTSHLKIYFPQILDWFEHLDTELVCAHGGLTGIRRTFEDHSSSPRRHTLITIRGSLRYGWLGKADPEREPASFVLFVPGKPAMRIVAQGGSPLPRTSHLLRQSTS